MKITSKNILHSFFCFFSSLVVILFFSMSSKAEEPFIDDFPKEFKELYEYKNKTIEINFSEQHSFLLNVEANYNTVRMNNNSDLSLLRESLQSYKISTTIIEELVTSLKKA